MLLSVATVSGSFFFLRDKCADDTESTVAKEAFLRQK